MRRWSDFLNLIRVIFPKWSFFDQVGTPVKIEAKPASASTWIRLEVRGVRAFGSLFHNPDTNLEHAFENCVSEFIQFLTPYLSGSKSLNEAELKSCLAFRQVCEWVKLQLDATDFRSGSFQFRLVLETGEVFFVSHELFKELE